MLMTVTHHVEFYDVSFKVDFLLIKTMVIPSTLM